jgi:hypothetical protein
MLASGQSLPLGAPFNPNGTQDLVARFATAQGLFNLALVEYGAVSQLGDFNGNGVLDAADIDDLTQQAASGQNTVAYDLNNDALVNEADVQIWVKNLFKSWIGDADLNHEFNSGDLVSVLASGTYEADLDAVWSSGDFNGDGRTNSGDLVAALADGGYELGPPPAVAVVATVAAVPEPSSLVLIAAGLLAALLARR